jgi:hypothetical protein
VSILPDFQDQLADAHEQHFGARRRSRRIRRVAARALVAAVLVGTVVGVILVAPGGPATETEKTAAPPQTPATITGRIVFVNATVNAVDNLAAMAEEQAGVEGELRNQRVAQQNSEVLYRPGFRDDAETLATRLTIGTVVAADPPPQDTSLYADALRGADVAVVLGLDRDPTASRPPVPVTPSEQLTQDGYQQTGQLPLHAVDDGPATGQFALYATPAGNPPRLAFQLVGENLPHSNPGEAYAVWILGGDNPHFLGYAPDVGRDGRLGVSGPRSGDDAALSAWINDAKRVILTVGPEQMETPGTIVLEGNLR